VVTDQVQLEVGECDCGYHFGIDVSFLEQVGDFMFECPSCGITIDTEKVMPEEEREYIIPKDIIKAVGENEGTMDEAVHDIKGDEAATINNSGLTEQISYLKGKGWSWKDFRETLGLPQITEDADESSP
jgi:hypothetical protein